MAEDRIEKLSQRFRTHAVGRRPTAGRVRERHSFYLDGALVDRLDLTYRDVNHELHPKSINKSVFLETVLEYGLAHLSEIQETLAHEIADGSDNS